MIEGLQGLGEWPDERQYRNPKIHHDPGPMWERVLQNPRRRWHLGLEDSEAGEATEHTYLPAGGGLSQ